MGNFEFQNPWLLLLLLLIPLLIFLRIKRKKPDDALIISSLKPFENSESLLAKFKPLLFVFRLIAIALMIIALARPQIVEMTSTVKSDKGIDILMVVDTSLSMLARDLKPDRLEALKEVAENFAIDRPTDRIGLVAYSGEAIAKVPLTTDHKVLIEEIRKLKTGELEDGTAIGVGLATAINHLTDSKAASKIIILITDGVESIDYRNDLLYISPQDATQIAVNKDIKVYTIGVGTNGRAPFPTGRDLFDDELIFTMQPVDIDEPLLKYIAGQTGGQYFRATDNESLQEIYSQIDQMEKTEINEIKYYNYTELFMKFLTWALVFLAAEFILRKTLFKELT
ncbi:vWA domain-containing protein [Moheibacter lacus]|uniref:VWA domain-containing protein n=1 Tax=Moheibacter lacus TaxID=2745851 RepID=A0A838ZH38_9FLAO|nr:VWA domain-containing protein [Moheibacter lacus]MBA5629001.1 VWA domain-containing protein [Moheibacter lacus]